MIVSQSHEKFIFVCLFVFLKIDRAFIHNSNLDCELNVEEKKRSYKNLLANRKFQKIMRKKYILYKKKIFH